MNKKGAPPVTTPTWKKQARHGQTTSLEVVSSGMFPAWQNQPRSGQTTSSEGAPLGMLPTWQSEQQSGHPTSSECVHKNNVRQSTLKQNKTQVLSHVSLLAPVQPDDIMAQIADICDLVTHDVALFNRIRENIDPRHLKSPPIIRRRVFYPWFRDIFSAAGVPTNFREHHPRTQIS